MPPSVPLGVLGRVRTASPCTVRWDDMTLIGAGDRVRQCGHCRQNVYNLANMTRAQARALIGTSEERVCTAYFQRPDGTVMVCDCPAGHRLTRRVHVPGVAGITSIVDLLGGAASPR